jgi:hypothetical protein
MFDRRRLKILPLAERVHDMHLAEVLALDAKTPPCDDPQIAQIAKRITHARKNKRPVILMMGAHVLKVGLSRFVIDWMERGIVTHVALNGAGVIHDYELALIGATTESVARYIQAGQFGLWRETARINDLVKAGLRDNLGYGEAVGRAIETEKFPHRDVSILAAGYRLRLPVTVHISIGYDITHEHANCDGAAIGEASYRDFLICAQAITELQGGVVLNFGSAIMAPEVYLKALAMARNVAHQDGKRINEFATAVFDLQDLGTDVHHEVSKNNSAYYFRPFKTMLVRTVADGGESFYVRGDHRATLPALYRRTTEEG